MDLGRIRLDCPDDFGGWTSQRTFTCKRTHSRSWMGIIDGNGLVLRLACSSLAWEWDLDVESALPDWELVVASRGLEQEQGCRIVGFGAWSLGLLISSNRGAGGWNDKQELVAASERGWTSLFLHPRTVTPTLPVPGDGRASISQGDMQFWDNCLAVRLRGIELLCII